MNTVTYFEPTEEQRFAARGLGHPVGWYKYGEDQFLIIAEARTHYRWDGSSWVSTLDRITYR
jgi:hypothetical protein